MTAVVGGLPISSSEVQCTAWLVEKINELCSVKPIRVYSKGDFKGMLWLVFDSSAVRDGVVETTWKAKLAMHASQIWIAPDLPIEMRAEKKILFGLIRLLLSWGWHGFETRVDTLNRSLTIDGHVVVRVHAYDQQFNVRFTNQWQQRLQDDALTALFNACNNMMVQRKVGKGASKGQQ